MSYYKYAERDESVQVNWAEIGKNLTQTFQQEATKRETQKAAIDENTRQYANILNTAPQGEFQDGNAFINNYVAAQQETRLLDDKLLKSGQMDMKTYNLRRQNGIDGTKQLFDLQKNFQSVYSERMKGIIDGSLQAQTAFELSQVQGFGDFSKSQALINPVDGRVQVGMTEIVDGVKKVIPNSNIPVNVLMGKIQAALPTFDINKATKSLVDSQGDLVFSLYKQGSILGAGTITELTGVDALEKFGKGEWTEAADLVNNAISKEVNAMLINPRNLTSVLTGQVGGYSAESFTYDKDVAAKDATKILLKPSFDGGPGVIDDKAPNYQKQYKQAEDWITTSIKSQMDSKVGVKETSQTQLQQPRAKSQSEIDLDLTKKDAENFATYLSYLTTGTDAQKAKAMGYFRSQGADIVSNPPGRPPGNYVRNSLGDIVSFESKGNPKENIGALAGALLTATGSDLPEDMVVNVAKRKAGGRYNVTFSGTGKTIDVDTEVTNKISKVNDDLFNDKNSTKTGNEIKKRLSGIPEVTVVAEGGGFSGNNITITLPILGKKVRTITVNSNQKSEAAAAAEAKKLRDFLEENLTEQEKLKYSGYEAPAAPNAKPKPKPTQKQKPKSGELDD